MKAVIPVAGNGTRMFPLGVTTPKALMRILNKPLITWTLEALAENHIEEAVIVLSGGKFGQLIQNYIEQSIIEPGSLPIKIHFVTQEQQLGTAHVIQQAQPFIGENEQFVFVYGDDLYGPKNIASVIASPTLAVVGTYVSDPEKWGIFQTNEAMNLVKVVEKPQEFVGDLANIGCMKLDSSIFKLYDQLKISIRGEYEITDSLQLMAQQVPIAVLPATDYWIPIGYPWHLLQANEYFLPKQTSHIEGTMAENTFQTGTLVLPKSSTILPGCYLEGNILVGEDVTIGPNARIRGETVVGDHSHIGFGVEVKNCVLGEHVDVLHLAFLGDSVLGNNINVAGGTMLANYRHDGEPVQTPVKGTMVSTLRQKFGAVIGDEVKLGVNTTMYPGRKIWPGLSTRPGQIVDKDLQQ